jgi:hypothetical protein
MDQYTHTFDYRLGDGGKYINGQIRLKRDETVIYKVEQWSDPMPHELLQAFSEFVDRIKMRYDIWDGIKLVRVKEKGYNP